MVHLIIHLFDTSLIPFISLDQYLTPNFTIYQICKICVSFAVTCKYIKHTELYLHSVVWVIRQWLDVGVLGVKNIFFPNMVICHIQLKGVMKRTEYKYSFHHKFSNW